MIHCLVYKGAGENIIGYLDADLGGGDEQDRRSCTGFVFKLAGAAVSWVSRKQCTITVSSTEAEYVAVAEATKEAV
jgi:hypothetical protein